MNLPDQPSLAMVELIRDYLFHFLSTSSSHRSTDQARELYRRIMEQAEREQFRETDEERARYEMGEMV